MLSNHRVTTVAAQTRHARAHVTDLLVYPPLVDYVADYVALPLGKKSGRAGGRRPGCFWAETADGNRKPIFTILIRFESVNRPSLWKNCSWLASLVYSCCRRRQVLLTAAPAFSELPTCARATDQSPPPSAHCSVARYAQTTTSRLSAVLRNHPMTDMMAVVLQEPVDRCLRKRGGHLHRAVPRRRPGPRRRGAHVSAVGLAATVHRQRFLCF